MDVVEHSCDPPQEMPSSILLPPIFDTADDFLLILFDIQMKKNISKRTSNVRIYLSTSLFCKPPFSNVPISLFSCCIKFIKQYWQIVPFLTFASYLFPTYQNIILYHIYCPTKFTSVGLQTLLPFDFRLISSILTFYSS